MDSIAKADIFFFVTTIAIALLTIGGIIIIAYVWRIVRNVRDVTERFRDQAYKVSEDIDEMRKTGMKGVLAGIVTMGSLFKKRNKKNHEKKHKESNS
jgi:hypothetical protein